jgi:hypothetical protein
MGCSLPRWVLAADAGHDFARATGDGAGG